MKLPPFVLVEPNTIDDVLGELAAPGSLLMAGGQGLLLRLRTGEARAGRLVSLRGVDGLGGMANSDGSIRVGARLTIRELLEGAPPFLASPASRIGNEAVRTMATVGGNLVHAAATSEILLALLATGGRAFFTVPSGARESVAGMDICHLGTEPQRRLITELAFQKPLGASFGEYGPQGYWVPQFAVYAALRHDGSLAVACAAAEGDRRLFESVPHGDVRRHVRDLLRADPLATRLPADWMAGVVAHHCSLAMADRREGIR